MIYHNLVINISRCLLWLKVPKRDKYCPFNHTCITCLDIFPDTNVDLIVTCPCEILGDKFVVSRIGKAITETISKEDIIKTLEKFLEEK